MRPVLTIPLLLTVLIAVPSPAPAQPGAMGTASLEFNGKAMDQWIREIDDSDPSVRELAIKVVTQYGPAARKAIPALLRQLNATDLSPKSNAAIALGYVTSPDPGEQRMVVEGLGRLLNSSQGIVRYQAATSLGRLGPVARLAVPRLSMTLTDQDSFEIRKAAAIALGVCGRDELGVADIRALRALVGAVEDRCKDVRLDALQGLINLGPPGSPGDILIMKQHLEPRIRSDKDKSVAIWARVALMRMDPTAVNDANLTAIAKLIKFPDTSVGIQACRALGVIGPAAKSKIQNLIETLPNPDIYLAGEAAWALGRMGKDGEKALPSLRTLAQHKDEYPRVKAIEAMRGIESAK